MFSLCATQMPRGGCAGVRPKYLPNGQLLDLPTGAGSTRSCNLYASGNFCDEFLRSARFFHFYSRLPQLSVKLGWRPVMDPGESQASGGFHVGRDIINV